MYFKDAFQIFRWIGWFLMLIMILRVLLTPCWITRGARHVEMSTFSVSDIFQDDGIRYIRNLPQSMNHVSLLLVVPIPLGFEVGPQSKHWLAPESLYRQDYVSTFDNSLTLDTSGNKRASLICHVAVLALFYSHYHFISFQSSLVTTQVVTHCMKLL